MKTIPTELICNRPDGWEVWCFTDAGKFSRRFVQKGKPTMEQIMAWVDTLSDTAPDESAIEDARITAEIEATVDKINYFAENHTAKTSKILKEKAPKLKVEGLLSADGAAVEIVEKTEKGWKA